MVSRLAAFLVLVVAAVGAAGCSPLTPFEETYEPDAVYDLELLEDRYAELDGLRIRYKRTAEAETAAVFVHGWASDMTVWRRQVPSLGDRLAAIYVDLPGHGKSDAPEIDYSIPLFARAVKTVMDDAGVSRGILVGHGNGTPVTRQVYREFPESVAAIVVVEGNLEPVASDPKRLKQMADSFRSEDYLVLAKRMVPPGTPGYLKPTIESMFMRTPSHVMASSLEALGDPAIWVEDPIDVPALVLLARSPFWSEETEAYARRLIPDVDYRMLDEASHFFMMESPEIFETALFEFCAQRGLLEP